MTPKNSGIALSTVMADIYVAPASGAVVRLAQVANIDGIVDVDVTVVWADASNGDAETALCFNATVGAGDALAVLAGPLALEAGDKIRALASAAGDAVITVSVLEG